MFTFSAFLTLSDIRNEQFSNSIENSCKLQNCPLFLSFQFYQTVKHVSCASEQHFLCSFKNNYYETSNMNSRMQQQANGAAQIIRISEKCTNSGENFPISGKNTFFFGNLVQPCFIFPIRIGNELS